MLEPRPPDGEGLPAAAPAARPRVRTAWRPDPSSGLVIGPAYSLWQDILLPYLTLIYNHVLASQANLYMYI